MEQGHIKTTYNNSHCQAHLLADLLTIPLMYNLVLWNNFLKNTKKQWITKIKKLYNLVLFLCSMWNWITKMNSVQWLETKRQLNKSLTRLKNALSCKPSFFGKKKHFFGIAAMPFPCNGMVLIHGKLPRVLLVERPFLIFEAEYTYVLLLWEWHGLV